MKNVFLPATGALQRWCNLLESFRTMRADTNRPNTIMQLAREGQWREMDGLLRPRETLTMIIQAATDNGYLGLHGYDQLMSIIDGSRDWAEGEYVRRGGVGRAGRSTPITSCTHSVQRYVDDIHLSLLTPATKRQLYTAAAIRRAHPDWTHLVMSARATAAAARVNKCYVGPNWRTAEKVGYVAFNPGVDYETAKLLGVSSKSSEIVLNLDIYSDEPVARSLVNLDDYEAQVANFHGYIKYKRAADRDEKQAHLKAHDISAIPLPEPVSPDKHAANVAYLKELLGES